GAKGLALVRAVHALRSGGAAPTGGEVWGGLRWVCGRPLPGGGGVGPGACCARRSQRGRWSYSSGVGSLSLLRRLRERREEGRFSVVAVGLLRFSMAWPAWASIRASPLARRRVWRTSLLSCRA